MIGLPLGIGLAAGLAWYLNMTPPDPDVEEPAPASVTEPVRGEVDETRAAPASSPATAQTEAPAARPSQPRSVTQGKASARPAPAARTPRRAKGPPPSKPQVNYTFYGILPGDKPARPVEPPPSGDTWWLQIAALSDARKAEQIRASLRLLHLRASTQRIDNKGQTLYRIRVGPYKREDDAFGDLDILTQNDFYARLIKDPAHPD
ncbi:MAG TPA: SPOR domain-containing protein [Thiobacillaceae bacterium]|nr:SPOR domain-containing protein [Thiobacillaceae bacterium]